MLQREEFAILDELRTSGPLPDQLEARHQKLRRQQLFAAGLKAHQYPPPATLRLEDSDMTVTDWLRERWSSADEPVRNALRLLAEALSIPLPLIRTKAILAKPTPVIRRSESTRHTNQHGEPALSDTLVKKYGLDYHDPPEWDDELADGWEPVESLRDAFRSDDGRGWY